ncbi:hypothetical protein NL676_023552 [Syzygium grande]|nr:hypothetical protein NL676_023552 [Syzygium grande]
MMKTAKEFTTLCGVDTCMIIYGPAGSAAATEPEVWPASPEKVNTELMNAQLANWEAKYLISEVLIEGLSKEDLRRLLGSLSHKLEAAKARLAIMKEHAMRRSSSHAYDPHVT